MHNALQGADINLSEVKTSIFEEVNFWRCHIELANPHCKLLSVAEPSRL